LQIPWTKQSGATPTASQKDGAGCWSQQPLAASMTKGEMSRHQVDLSDSGADTPWAFLHRKTALLVAAVCSNAAIAATPKVGHRMG